MIVPVLVGVAKARRIQHQRQCRAAGPTHDFKGALAHRIELVVRGLRHDFDDPVGRRTDRRFKQEMVRLQPFDRGDELDVVGGVIKEAEAENDVELTGLELAQLLEHVALDKVIPVGRHAVSAQIFGGILDQVLPPFDPRHVCRAVQKGRMAPPPVMARQIQDALAFEQVRVAFDQRDIFCVQAIAGRAGNAGVQKPRVAVEEIVHGGCPAVEAPSGQSG